MCEFNEAQRAAAFQAQAAEAVLAVMVKDLKHEDTVDNCCKFARNSTFGQDGEARTQAMFQLGFPEAILASMQKYPEHQGIIVNCCVFARNSTAGQDDEACKQAMFQLGFLEAILASMQKYPEHQGIIENCCAFARNSTGGQDDEARRQTMFQLGFPEAILAIMQKHPEHEGTQKSCLILASGLNTLSMPFLEAVAACTQRFRTQAMWDYGTVVLVNYFSKASGFRSEAKSLLAPSVFIEVACQHAQADTLQNCAACLSAWEQVEVEDTTRAFMTDMADADQLARINALTNDVRYTWRAALKDIFFMLLDMALDVLNGIHMIQNKRWRWASLVGSAMVANGIITASGDLSKKRHVLAFANLMSFGLSGLLIAAVSSLRTGHKSADIMLHKVSEGVESVMSLLVTADAIAVSGNMKGYAAMSMPTAISRWGSVGCSCVLLPLLALDVAKAQVFKNTCGCGHWVANAASLWGQVAIFLFHASELVANLCVIVLMAATDASSTVLSAIALGSAWLSVIASMYVMGAQKTAEVQGHSTPITACLKAGCLSAPIFAMMNLLGFSDSVAMRPPTCKHSHRLTLARLNYTCDVCNYSSRGQPIEVAQCRACDWGMCMNCLRQTAPDAGKSFERHVAMMKPCFWMLVWLLIAVRAYADEKVRNILLTPHLLALAGLSLTACVFYLPMAVHQHQAGRWGPSATEQVVGASTHSTLLVKGSEYQKLCREEP
eukprot:TRINITY_DN1173_c0_g1_i1.p1 TRINITY_DN1173_c0_g1~~TRINITY_DN1173_c0_g1_i1.p1  ORF type:complete len:785 (+),score=137.36 TRINITY_DN1173_c0_g1_i1:193-2355(+)